MIIPARLTDFITSLQSGTSGRDTQAAQLDSVSAALIRTAASAEETQSSHLYQTSCSVGSPPFFFFLIKENMYLKEQFA